MKISDITAKLCEYGGNRSYENSCDTFKSGNPDGEVKKIAVSMFASVDIIKQAKDWGAQLLIVHEPTYYSHMDVHTNDPIECEKRELLEKSGLTVFRFHDHPHFEYPDMIAKGVTDKMALGGKCEFVENAFDLARITLDKASSPIEIADIIEKNLGINHIRICGNRDALCTNISLMCGTPGGVFNELKRPETEILLTGEACEWMLGEYARDAALLGHKKTLMIMGHIGSERAGMEYISSLLKESFPNLDVRYFECSEVCTYTD